MQVKQSGAGGRDKGIQETDFDMFAATTFLWAYAQWRIWQLGVQRPATVQQAELLKLVFRARSTRFGRDHDFAAVKSVADFQQRVPLRRYEDFWAEYWKAGFPRLENCTWPGTIPYFAVTSGTTTGVTKYIPCSRDMVRANSRAAQDILVHHLINHPTSRMLSGKTFMLGGSTDLHEEAPGIYSGDLSGIELNEVPWWAQPFIFPPRELALLADWDEKIDRVARLSLNEDIRTISGTTSWLLLFFDKLAELRPDVEQRIVNYYPRLELLVHGGIDFKPYAKRFSDLLEGSRAELREVYPASEGFIAIADRGQGEGMRLIVDNGIFYEFVPTEELGNPEPTRHWLGNVETGIDYAVVLSTCAGAWGYILGDTVRFVETDPPRIFVTGRTSYVLSAFGEHLIAEEVEEAVAAAAEAIAATVTDYCVAPVFPQSAGARGGHHYVVEFAGGRPSAKRLAVFRDALDDRLRELNADYREHRAEDYGLRPPEAEAVPPGTFRAWMKSRGQLGGQHKVPRIVNDADLFANLTAYLLKAGKKPGSPNKVS
jgi:hypothetical protein